LESDGGAHFARVHLSHDGALTHQASSAVPPSEPSAADFDHIERQLLFVMAGLVPAIHVFLAAPALRRGARIKSGHDELYVPTREASMTAYLISLALAGLVAIAVWEGLS
jgi:hypothetical protein